MNHAVAEPAFVRQLEPQANTGREGARATSHHDGRDEQVALVHQAGSDDLGGEVGTASGDVTFGGCLRPADGVRLRAWTRTLLGWDGEALGISEKPSRVHFGSLGVWITDRAIAIAATDEQRARQLAAELADGRMSPDDAGRRVREAWDFDDVIYRDPGHSDAWYEFVLMGWLQPGDEYERNGGDERFMSAAEALSRLG